MQSFEPTITATVYDVLSVEKSIASRQSFGGTAPKEVQKQITSWRETLKI